MIFLTVYLRFIDIQRVFEVRSDSLYKLNVVYCCSYHRTDDKESNTFFYLFGKNRRKDIPERDVYLFSLQNARMQQMPTITTTPVTLYPSWNEC